MTKRICIIGASAGVGLECVRVALERGHCVVSLSRNVASLPRHPLLEIVQGNAKQVDDLRRATAGADAVLVCLGTGMSTRPTTLYTDFGAALIQLEDAMGDTPVLVLTGFGAGESAQYHGFWMGLLFRFMLKAVYDNKTALERMVTASRLNWMLVRPGVLTSGPSTGAAHVQTEYAKGMRVGRIPRRTVAEFMVGQAEAPTLMKTMPALSARA